LYPADIDQNTVYIMCDNGKIQVTEVTGCDIITGESIEVVSLIYCSRAETWPCQDIDSL
jgi:hypothetical protein